VRSLEARLVSYFDGHDLTMPPMPRVAERVLKALRDPKCSMTELAKVLSEDQVTAADVLRLVNSPLYRGAYKITTLQGAVTRLGTQILRTLMLHQSLRSVMFPKKSEAHGLARMLWSRSLASGCVMRELAPLIQMDGEDAFTLGLLHDIGSVIVLRTVSEQESVSHHWLDEEVFEYLCYETHQEFGELIAEEWQLPETIKAIVASHHSAPAADDPLAKQRWLTLFSDMICQMTGYGPPRQYDLLASEPAWALGLAEHPDTVRVLRALPDRVSSTLTHLA
jgi:HD-like signal output (HDOD) protein